MPPIRRQESRCLKVMALSQGKWERFRPADGIGELPAPGTDMAINNKAWNAKVISRQSELP